MTRILGSSPSDNRVYARYLTNRHRKPDCLRLHQTDTKKVGAMIDLGPEQFSHLPPPVVVLMPSPKGTPLELVLDGHHRYQAALEMGFVPNVFAITYEDYLTLSFTVFDGTLPTWHTLHYIVCGDKTALELAGNNPDYEDMPPTDIYERVEYQRDFQVFETLTVERDNQAETITVREAKKKDIEQCIDMARAFCEVLPDPFDETYSRGQIKAAILHPHRAYVVAENKDGLLVGFGTGHMTLQDFTGTPVAEEHGLYVHPAYRHTGVFHAIARSAQTWTHQKQGKYLAINFLKKEYADKYPAAYSSYMIMTPVQGGCNE